MDRIRLEFVMNVTEENLIAVMKGVVEGSAHWCCQMEGFKKHIQVECRRLHGKRPAGRPAAFAA